MHLGSEYQVRVAAWLAVEMLAEGQGLFAPGDRVSMLRGETQESALDAGRTGHVSRLDGQLCVRS